MSDSAAYLLMILSPIALFVPYLNIRYSIVYSVLRKKHSKTYLKKNKGPFWNWVFFCGYKKEIGRGWYFVNTAAVLLEMLSLLFAVVYLVLWMAGHTLQIAWIPWIWAYGIIVIYGLYVIKLLSDKLTATSA